jgi:response regulator RpfG family c-di-GMP phosphodiesterase
MKNNVFYIEKEKFLRSMFEIAFKNNNTEIYTIDSIIGNYYLIDDLLPTIIVFDVKSIGAELEAVLQYKDKAVLVATGDIEDQNQVKSRVNNFILKPIPAVNLVKTILGFATRIE